MAHTPTSLSLADLNDRARTVFKTIVETYLGTGIPVGSRTLSQIGTGEHTLSPATLRNTMADLAEMGLLSSTHISAGRMPTHAGLRLFVDGLLEIGDLAGPTRQAIENNLSPSQKDQSLEQVLENASSTLAGLAGGAGIVLAPEQSGALRHVEFVGLDGGQALVIMVYADGHVENRIINRPDGVMPSALERASNFLSNRLKGKKLSEARTDILTEITNGQAALDAAAASLVQQGIASWTPKNATQTAKTRNLIVRGQAQLLDNRDVQTDLERIRLLFEDLERKEELIDLLDKAEAADGVKIFIGAENPLFSLSGSSVVVAPYRDSEQKIIGALGVIGPTRLNYARVIPMVDYTANWVGRLLQSSS